MNPETLMEFTISCYPELAPYVTQEKAENFLFSDPMASDASVDEFANYIIESLTIENF